MEIEDVKTLYRSYLFQNYGREDICLSRGEAEFLYDQNGQRYVDFVAGIAVNCLGHAHPAMVQAISTQAAKMIHVSNLYYTMEQADLGESLASIVPSPLAVSMLCNSGTEAIEAALKLALKHNHRGRFISCYNSFHGRTAGALSATGQLKYQQGFEPIISRAFDFIDYNDVESLKSKLGHDHAGVILEMIQGEGGVIPASHEFVRTARDLTTDKGSLLIVDEVQTGIGRTGKWFGFEHHDIVPDIITLAKGLGGGMPIGAIVATREVAKAFQPGSHGTTFGGNPLACAAANAVIKTIKDERLLQRVAGKGATWKKELQKIVRDHSIVREVRGCGYMLGVEMGDQAKDFQKLCFANHMLVNVAGGKTVRIIPPLIISDESIHLFNERLDSFLVGQ